LEFVKVVADAGADLISMHGRTREQGYSGKANWHRIGEARKNVAHLPFLVNGDIVTPELAREAMDIAGADGVLIGRGGLGNPWFFKQVEHYLKTGVKLPEVTMQDRIDTVRKHARLQVEHYGERGLVKLRKHLPWYFKGLNTGDLKSKLVRINSIAELDEALDSIQSEPVDKKAELALV
jgi:tRNA-dihydrouridine synthase